MSNSMTPAGRIDELIAWLDFDAPPMHGVDVFDMAHFCVEDDCGTSCCLAGAACMFERARDPGVDDTKEMTSEGIFNMAASLLGLGDVSAMQLFFHHERGCNNPAVAAEVLRIYRREGIVDWKRAIATVRGEF